MKKQYKLKDSIKLEEIRSHGYSPCSSDFCGCFVKFITDNSKAMRAVVVNADTESSERRIYLLHRHKDIFNPIFLFDKKKLPYIKDLLDAGLLEEVTKPEEKAK